MGQGEEFDFQQNFENRKYNSTNDIYSNMEGNSTDGNIVNNMKKFVNNSNAYIPQNIINIGNNNKVNSYPAPDYSNQNIAYWKRNQQSPAVGTSKSMQNLAHNLNSQHIQQEQRRKSKNHDNNNNNPSLKHEQKQYINKSPRAASINTANIAKSHNIQQQQQLHHQYKNTMTQRPIVPYALRKYFADIAKYRIYEIIETANVSIDKILDESYWNNIIAKWFTSTSTINISKSSANSYFSYISKMFPALCTAARYLNISRFEAYPHQVFTEVLSNGSIFFCCLRLSFTYHYQDGSYVTHFSQFKGVFNTAFLIEWMDFDIHSFVPGVDWNSLENTITNPKTSFEISKNLTSSDPFNSQFQSKSQYGENDPQNATPEKLTAISQLRSNFDIFKNISNSGARNDFVRLLQINEIMSDLRSVRMYQKKHDIDSPLEAFKAFVANNIQHITQNQPANPDMKRTASVPLDNTSINPQVNIKAQVDSFNRQSNKQSNQDNNSEMYDNSEATHEGIPSESYPFPPIEINTEFDNSHIRHKKKRKF